MSASSKKKLRKEQNAAALTEKQQKAQAEAKKLKITTIIFVAVIAIILVTALAVMLVSGIRNSGIIEKNTIALTVGEHDIDSVEMNYFFIDTVNNTYNEWTSMYGDNTAVYMASMGLDVTQPLDEQEYIDGSTWADYFMDMAISQATASYALYDEAIANGFTMTDETQLNIDSNINMLQMYASLSGYSTEDYLKLYYGSGTSEKSLRAYMEVTNLASAYYNEYQNSLTYDDAAIRAYEADKYENYNAYSYSSYYMSRSAYLTEEESLDPTEEQLNAALVEAKAAAESLLTATNEDELNAAIAALPVNEGSTATAITYTDTLYTSIGATVRDWVTDEARQENDIAMIPYETVVDHEHDEETEHEHEYETLGYYVVLFHGSNDNTQPMGNVRHLLVQFEENEDGTVSDKVKAMAKEEADGYLNTWKSGEATEESFIELVKEYSDDSSASTGGLFEDINPASNYVANFLNWSIDPQREAGDAEVIETEFGYHVMYYVGDDELSYRDYLISQELALADMEAWYTAIIDAASVTEKDFSRINVSLTLASA